MSEQRVSANKAVHFTYFIIDQSGDQVEHSDVPIGYIHSSTSSILPKLGESMDGHAVDDVIEVSVSAEEGFGPHRPELTFTDDIANVPEQFHHVGAEVEMQNDEGEVKKFRVSAIENGKLTIDGNHPFAGQAIKFTVTITEIRDASNEEIASGQVADGPFGPLQ